MLLSPQLTSQHCTTQTLNVINTGSGQAQTCSELDAVFVVHTAAEPKMERRITLLVVRSSVLPVLSISPALPVNVSQVWPLAPDLFEIFTPLSLWMLSCTQSLSGVPFYNFPYCCIFTTKSCTSNELSSVFNVKICELTNKKPCRFLVRWWVITMQSWRRTEKQYASSATPPMNIETSRCIVNEQVCWQSSLNTPWKMWWCFHEAELHVLCWH